MNPKEIVQELYANDGLRNRDFLNEVLHDDVILVLIQSFFV